MHPDRRHAGRAIRKQRREVREMVSNYSAFVEIVRGWSDLSDGVTKQLTAAFVEIGQLLQTPFGKNDVALLPGLGSAVRETAQRLSGASESDG